MDTSFSRAFKSQFKLLNPLLKESKVHTKRITNKLVDYPNILVEFDFIFEKDFNTKKLMFLDVS